MDVPNLPESLQLLAESQQGMITRRQAFGAGLTRDAIGARISGGRWQRVYPGVFAVFSGEPCRVAALWAAVLWAGPGAALSHHTAAELHGLTRKPPQLVHVTVPADRRVRRVPGIVIHRSARILTARHPAQSPPRTRIEETVLDLTQLARTFVRLGICRVWRAADDAPADWRSDVAARKGALPGCARTGA